MRRSIGVFVALVLATAIIASLFQAVPVAAAVPEPVVPELTSPSPMPLPPSATMPDIPLPAPVDPGPSVSPGVDLRQPAVPDGPRPSGSLPPRIDPSDPTRPPTVAPFDPTRAQVVDHTEKADVYRTDTGMWAVRAYAHPVNFKDAAGQWQRIDNHLVQRGLTIVNAAGAIHDEFPLVAGVSPVATFSTVDWSIGFAPAVAPSRATVADNRVTYPNAFANTDLSYEVTTSSVKEWLKLTQPPSAGTPLTFHFPLRLKGVRPVAEADGSISFVDSTDTVVGAIPPGQALDSAGDPDKQLAPAHADVHYTLVNDADGPAIDLSVAPAWMADPARVYPVLIDPTFSAGRGTAADDMYVSSAQPTTTFNQGNQSNGVRYIDKGGYTLGPTTEYDSYIKYDLTPAMGATNIFRADWHAYFYTGVNTHPLNAWVLAGAFNSSITGGGTTFNTRPGHRPDFAGISPVGNRFMTPYDLRLFVVNWTNGTWANNGLVLDTAGATDSYYEMAADEMGGVNCTDAVTGAVDACDSYLDIQYNNAPRVSTQLSPPNGGWVTNTLTPTLQATYSDPDVDDTTGFCFFYITDTVTGQQVVPGGGFASAPNGGTCSYTLPSALVNGRTYTWTAQGKDIHGIYGPASGSWSFTVQPIPTMTKSVVGGPYSRGQLVQYAVHVANPSPNTLLATSVRDTLPTGLATSGFSVTVPGGARCTGSTTPACSFTPSSGFFDASFTLGPVGSATDHVDYTVNAIATGTEANCGQVVNGLVGTNAAASASAAAPPIDVCDTQLGMEPWWSYINQALGPEATASVNVSNGNVVVSQMDSTPIQAHGHLAYVVRRTYNSQDKSLLTLPSSTSIGKGWVLNVGAADDLTGAGIGPSGLFVPSIESVLSPLAVTLIDRDGTHHVFQPTALTAAVRVGTADATGTVTAAGGIAASATLSKALKPAANTTVCVDQTYRAPKGVHLGLWRYIQVSSTAATACDTASIPSESPVVLGFATERPDRLRSEFAATGELVDVVDGNGVELRYLYSTGKLQVVYEAKSCAATALPIPTTCRAMRFSYPSSTETDITDPAGRVTKYFFDAAGRLTSVTNPPDPTATTTSFQYAYGTCGGSANQLCTVTDPRGKTTTFAYTAGKGPAQSEPFATSMTDRRGTVTSFDFNTPGAATVTAGSTQRRSYSGIDTAGRVGRLGEGVVGGTDLRVTNLSWDLGGGCTLPGTPVADNNLCKVDRDAGVGATTPAETTSYVYSREGRLVKQSQGNARVGAVSTTLFTTYGYHTQYLRGGGTNACSDLNPSGSGNVVLAATGCTAQPDAQTLFAVTDMSASLPPRGNAAGAGFAPFQTIYVVDNDGAKAPNAMVAASTCGNTAAGSGGNTGNLCETRAPAWGGTNVDGSGTATITRYSYDNFGQRVTMTTPKIVGEGTSANDAACPKSLACYRYTYYADTDFDLVQSEVPTGAMSIGGYLKAVSDPTSTTAAPRFVAFAYDRAGNVVRTWDRSATARAFAANSSRTIAAYPGTRTTPPSSEYSETLYACNSAAVSSTCGGSTASYANPWRYVRATRDPLGRITSYEVNKNGTPNTIRPPRGNAVNAATFDVTQPDANIDGNDNIGQRKLPIAGNDGTLPASPAPQTVWTYDVFDNRVTETDPSGTKTTAWDFDAVNRIIATRWSRTSDSTLAPPPDGAGNLPCPNTDASFPGKFVCSTHVTYDGLDNATFANDANGARVQTNYDGVHRKTSELVPRSSTVLLRTEWVYDEDGDVKDVCTPRQFSEGGTTAGACGAAAGFATHYGYDNLDRRTQTTTYRTAGGTPNTVSTTYDADGNPKVVTDARGKPRTETYNVLDRLVADKVKRRVVGSTVTANVTGRQYDPSGNTTAIVSPGDAGTDCSVASPPATCRITAYSFDALNRVRDVVSGSDSVDATAAGLPSADGGRNVRIRVDYDEDGNVIRRYGPRAFTTSTSNPDLRFMVQLDYDANGRPIKQWEPRYDASVAQDVGGTPDAQTAQCPVPPAPDPFPGGVGVCITQFRYDAAGNRTLVILPTSTGINTDGTPKDNRYVKFAFTDDRMPVKITPPSPKDNSHTTPMATYRYDAVGRVLSDTRAPVTGQSVGHTDATTYTLDGLEATVTRQQATAPTVVTHVTTNSFDANGNLTKTADGKGDTTTQHYFSDGLLQEVCTYLTVNASCDDAGAVAAQKLRTTYAYDANGNAASVTSPSANAADLDNTLGIPTVTSYTDDNLPDATVQPVSTDGASRRRTTYDYDGSNNKLTQHVETVSVSPNTAKVLDAGATVTATADGGTQSFSYYADNRLKTETGRGTVPPVITTTYDPDGNRTSVADTSGGVVGSCNSGNVSNSTGTALLCATYYLDGLLRSVDDGARRVQYGYDGASNRSTRLEGPTSQAATQTTTYTQTDGGLPATATTVGVGTWSWNYDEKGRLLKQTNPDNEVENLIWNDDDTLRDKQAKASAAATTPLAHWTYTYDQAYRITGQTLGTDSVGAATGSLVTGSFAYSYDGGGRLTNFTDQALVSRNVTWDHDGNRTGYGQQVFKYRADDSILSATDTAGLNEKTYTYEVFGGVKNDGCSNYTYDGFDRNTQIAGTVGCGQTLPTTYTYDGLDRQRSHAESGGTPVAVSYDGLSNELSSEGATTSFKAFAVDQSGQQRALTASAVTTFLHDDGTGSVALTTSSTAQVTCTARFDPFGTPQGSTAADATNHVCNTGSTASDLFYRGARHDQSTGNYQFGARTYDPAKASFLTPDNLRSGPASASPGIGVDPLTRNTYAYVNGDPVNLVDPSGHGIACGIEFQGDPGGRAQCVAQNAAASEWQSKWQAADYRAAHHKKKGCGWNLVCVAVHDVAAPFIGGVVQGAKSLVTVPVKAVVGSLEVISDVVTAAVEHGLSAGLQKASDAVRAHATGLINAVGAAKHISNLGSDPTAFLHEIYSQASQYVSLASHQGVDQALKSYFHNGGTAVPALALAFMPGGQGAALEMESGTLAAESEAPLFSQTTASSTFRNGPFAGQSIGDAADALRAGKISSADLPVDVIAREGETIGLNTRSMLALRRAGVSPTDWLINDVTGVPEMEQLLTERLIRNGMTGGTDVLRITGAGPYASSLR